ncbi:uncharacterized protein LOC117586755 [Drosophila guanche]|uniref:uncharacterized protein LOC117586755 n=1 Tax=Drosophila guanche TaxID=7266 RepID=UPI001471E2EC|nr:uncharacterized protein LOC117586755 [Drosophila guanche]
MERIYKDFYTDEETRKKYNFKFDATPALQQRLLRFAKRVDPSKTKRYSIGVTISAKQSRTAPNEADPFQASRLRSPPDRRTFLKYINYEDTVGKLCNKSNSTNKQLMCRYYCSFYLDQKVGMPTHINSVRRALLSCWKS